jgi:hypothetical protein
MVELKVETVGALGATGCGKQKDSDTGEETIPRLASIYLNTSTYTFIYFDLKLLEVTYR